VPGEKIGSVINRLRGNGPAAGPRTLSIRRTPTILQMEWIECGAASLAMILAYHGLWVPLEQVRLACGVSRDGTKASNIVKAARKFGFNAKGFRKDPATLTELPMPCIIHWEFTHFVVLEGLDGRRAHLNDPAVGRRSVDLAEFDSSFTGLALAIEPGSEFRPAGRRPTVLPRLVRELREARVALLLLVLLSLALAVPGVIIPSFARIFVDNVLIGELGNWLTPLLVGMAVTAAARMLITTLQQSLLLRLETKLSVTRASLLFRHLMALPIEFFTQRHIGDIASRFAGNERISRLLSGEFATNILNLVALVFFAGAMAIYDLPLAALCIGISGLNVAAWLLIRHRLADLVRNESMQRGRVHAATVALIRTIETLKASGIEDNAFSRWAGFHARLLNLTQQVGRYTTLLGICPLFVSALTIATVLGVGALRVLDGALTIGGLVAFQSLMASFTAPVNALLRLAGGFQGARADLARIEDVLSYPATPDPPREASAQLAAPKLTGRIELRNVSFGYSAMEPPLIDGLSLRLEPGMRVALVGASGSGKSTIGRLICGLMRPWSGEILYDGVPLDHIPRPLLASSVAYVDQDIFLFEGTVRDNVTLWDATVPEADVSQALKDAAIQDEIAARVGNYGCTVAEAGTNFSGGQRQRIEIARTLVGNPSILVLDEATAALDPYTEHVIDGNLRRRGCTCIIIAHRISTIRDCDEIIVLEGGRVIERGTHDELIVRHGLYADLVGGDPVRAAAE
jgi:NHLM bacteriocin system ABC transporter peptidase/ATP-binding protein